jgi:hypothetical protein
MDMDRVKGAARNMVGKIKETFGKVTGQEHASRRQQGSSCGKGAKKLRPGKGHREEVTVPQSVRRNGINRNEACSELRQLLQLTT